jgi:short-subunit dehydrogenase
VGTIVIIGAGPGIGIATARRFAREGYDVALVARTPARLDGALAELRGLGVGAAAFAGDAGSAHGLAAVLETVEDQHGPIEVVHFNAVGFRPDAPSALTPEAIAHDLGVGVVGAVATAQAVLPALRERRGSLLFTGGGAAFMTMTAAVTLSICKAALRNYVLGLAKELEDGPVRIGTVTVATAVTAADATVIADAFWGLHTGAIAGPEVRYPSS